MMTACGQQNITDGDVKNAKLTLNFNFGERSGKYTGTLANGLPEGFGTFTVTDSENPKWTYEGNWKKGHFDGKGKASWPNGWVEAGTYKDDKIVPMSGEEVKTLYTETESFKDCCVEITGKVFSAPEYDQDGVSFQMWGDYDNSEKNTMVTLGDPKFEIKDGDYVKLVGFVRGTFEGQNMLGGKIVAPIIYSNECEVIEYKDLFAVIDEITVNQTINQLGYIVTVQKVEFTEKDTRVYVKIENNGKNEFDLYSFNAKLVHGGRQYEEQDDWNSNYPEVQTDLIAGVTTEGIIAFPPLEPGDVKIILDGSSEDYNERLDDYVYEAKLSNE
jgi:hypothetical protein